MSGAMKGLAFIIACMIPGVAAAQDYAPTPSPTGPSVVDPASLTDPQAQRGKAVYDRWCVHCHGGGEAQPGTAALAAKYEGALPALLEERTDLTPELTRTFVRNGVSVMAAFRKTEISDAELADLAAYLARPR